MEKHNYKYFRLCWNPTLSSREPEPLLLLTWDLHTSHKLQGKLTDWRKASCRGLLLGFSSLGPEKENKMKPVCEIEPGPSSW